jgi:uncharacterized protein DUF5990
MPNPSDEVTVRLRVICSPMPPKSFGRRERIELAQQVKQDLQPGVERPDGSMQFECGARVKGNPKTESPNFLGPPVHGPVGGRFLYLNWQGWDGDERQEFSRMKIHLSSITWEQIEAVSKDERSVLQATVSGVGRNGGPAAASVPLEGDGWEVVDA